VLCIDYHRIRQTTKGIKGVTVHSNGDTRGECRIFVEHMPVGMMVHRHETQNDNLSEPILTPFKPSNPRILQNYQREMRERETCIEIEEPTLLEPRLSEMKA
jgi:hypothetical protein